MELARPLGPVARLTLRAEYRDLAATAIRLRHKHAAKLARTRPEDLDDGTLAEVVLRLTGWIAEQPPLPVDPDSYLARHGS